MGGMLVASVTYLLWGFIAYRFTERRTSPRGVPEPSPSSSVRA
jgi:hypothetical protein